MKYIESFILARSSAFFCLHSLYACLENGVCILVIGSLNTRLVLSIVVPDSIRIIALLLILVVTLFYDTGCIFPLDVSFLSTYFDMAYRGKVLIWRDVN